MLLAKCPISRREVANAQKNRSCHEQIQAQDFGGARLYIDAIEISLLRGLIREFESVGEFC